MRHSCLRYPYCPKLHQILGSVSYCQVGDPQCCGEGVMHWAVGMILNGSCCEVPEWWVVAQRAYETW